MVCGDCDQKEIEVFFGRVSMGFLPIYIFTNGRSTFPHCFNSVMECEDKEEVTIVQDQKLAPALNNIIENNVGYFFKVDDDFLLHPKALTFMQETVRPLSATGWAIYAFAIWDVFFEKKIGNIKIYNAAEVRRLGGFVGNEFNRVDGNLSEKCKRCGVKILQDKKSFVGIHLCGSAEDQQIHAQLWNGKIKVQPTDAAKFYQQHSMQDFFNRRSSILDKLNKERESKFHNWKAN